MHTTFSNRSEPNGAVCFSRVTCECARNEHARKPPECMAEYETMSRAHRWFDARAQCPLRTINSLPIRVAQTAGARRWMRPTLASVGELERARVVATADELMGTWRPTRHHSHRAQKIHRHSTKPCGAQSQLAAVAPPPPCQASAAQARALHCMAENEVGPRTHLWPISANRLLPRRLPLAGK